MATQQKVVVLPADDPSIAISSTASKAVTTCRLTIKTALIATSVSILVIAGRLVLGIWQASIHSSICVAPRRCQIVLHLSD